MCERENENAIEFFILSEGRKGGEKDIWRRDYDEGGGGDLFHMKKVFFPRPRGCKWTAHKATLLDPIIA